MPTSPFNLKQSKNIVDALKKTLEQTQVGINKVDFSKGSNQIEKWRS
jgi:hypothetical protein